MIADIVQNLISQLGPEPVGARRHKSWGRISRTSTSAPRSTGCCSPRRSPSWSATIAGTPQPPVGDWEKFFPEGAVATELLTSSSGTITPHLALLIAFVKLHQLPREVMNRLTGTHLDFFYRRVLDFDSRAAVPDRAHVLVELKKNASPVAVTPQHLLSAGKDPAGVELLYAPVREAVVNAARVTRLCSRFLDGNGRGTVRFAPVANSSDGVGG